MSNFAPTSAELAFVNQILAVADPQKIGIVTGDVAVKIFAGAKLPPTVLGEIWALSDRENNGFLTRKGLAIATRLIGHAQKGETVKEALIDKPGPLPHIEGVSRPPTAETPPPKSPPPSTFSSSYPPLSPQDRSKFARLFTGCGPVNGLLGGDKARDVFVKSKLPVEKLSQIWNLADSHNRGSLDQTDFTVAMYLIQASMSGQLKSLPSTLPPSVYEQAGGRPSSVASNSGSISPSFANTFSIPSTQRPSSPLASQYTGLSQTLKQAPSTSSPLASRPAVTVPGSFGAAAFQTPQAWDVTAEEKANSDRFFENLDSQKRGYIEGDVAVPFMLQSKLSEDVLAQVWDLSDLNNDGRLTREGFAVAMHLIQGKLTGKEIPSAIPNSLIPPSMRGKAPAPSAPVPAVEDIKDLLWDDSPLASTTTGSSSSVAGLPPRFSSPQPSLQPQRSPLSQQTSRALSPQPTPAPAFPQTVPRANVFSGSPFVSSASKDLFGDDDGAAATSSIPDNSAEIGNVQNQLNSTNGSLARVKAERQTVEQNLANQASQLSTLQTQLSSAKAAYETENRLLETLRARLATQTAEIQQVRHDLITAESTLSALRIEKTEVGTALLSDKDEVRELQRKMKEVGDEIEQLKVGTEKVKKEAKQQKGLLAIARKQLSTREAERAKVALALAEAQAEAEAATKEREAVEAELAVEPEPIQTNGSTIAPVGPPRTDTPSFAAGMPLPATPLASSPTGSLKSRNPFDRLNSGSGASSPFAASPFAPFAADSHALSPQVVEQPAAQQPAVEELSEDPFGFSDLPPEPTASLPVEPSTTESQPTSVQSESPFYETISSPLLPQQTNLFEDQITATSSPAVATEQDPIIADAELESAVSKFPVIETEIGADNPAITQPSASDAPLDPVAEEFGGPLKEIEHDESDSDSDTEEFHDTKGRLSADSQVSSEFTPLAAPPVNGASAPLAVPSTSVFDDAFGDDIPLAQLHNLSAAAVSSPPLSDATTPRPESSLAQASSQSFSPSNSTQAVPDSSKSPASAQAVPVFGDFSTPKIASPPPQVASPQPPVSSINDFDEAMGKMPKKETQVVPEFSFDSNFDDTFDFGSFGNNEAGAPSVPAKEGFAPAAPAVNGSGAAQSSGFDNIFGLQQETHTIPSGPGPSQAIASNGLAADTQPFSFDDAFGSTTSPPQAAVPVPNFNIASNNGFGNTNGAAKSVSFDDAFGIQGAPASPPNPAAPSHGSNFISAERTASPPASPASHISHAGSGFVARSISPPPRQSSPSPSARPRPSTASSIDSAAPGKSGRHSKISIRLPFGRKDKKKTKTFDPPPVPPPQTGTGSHLSPVPEPPRFSSPLPDDDVEPVKQLMDLGFNRNRAIAALEANAYDFQRALNSLVGAA